MVKMYPYAGVSGGSGGSVAAATIMAQNEVVLVTASTTHVVPASGRKSVEVYNAGPNPILVGPAEDKVLRVIPSKESWAADFTGDLFMKATIGDQVAGAATVVTELS